MVVCADEELRRLTALKLASAGCDVLADCDDLRSAVLAIDAVRPDLVLTDLHLSGPDGMALIGYLRGTPPFQLTPVILLADAADELPEFDTWSRVVPIHRPASTAVLARAVNALRQEVALRGRRRTPGGAGVRF